MGNENNQDENQISAEQQITFEDQAKEITSAIEGVITAITSSKHATGITYAQWRIQRHHNKIIPEGSFGAIWETKHVWVAKKVIENLKVKHNMGEKTYNISAGALNPPLFLTLEYLG